MKELHTKTIFTFMIGFFMGINFAILHHFSYIFQPDCDVNNDNSDQKYSVFHLPTMKSYEKWLEKQHLTRSSLNLDFDLYGPKLDTIKDEYHSKVIESDWLKKKVHVTCVVFIEKVKMMKAIRNTWGSRCNKLLFIGKRKLKIKKAEDSEPVILFDRRVTSSWQLLCETFNIVWKEEKTERKQYLEWIIFVNEDTMIVPENLRFLVAKLDFNDDYYLGHPITMWRQKYNVAEAGIVLSRRTLNKLVDKFNSSDVCSKGGRFWKMEDFYLGQHLESLNVHPSDTRDRKLRGIFHGYSLQILMWGIARPTNYWTKALYPIGTAGCCSPMSVTFSVSEADKLYTLNYLMYHLRVHQNFGIYGNKPAPTPVPEEQVWKETLKKEFGLDNFTEISSQQYYDIWRSMYSEPEEFFAKKFHPPNELKYSQNTN